MTFRQVLRPELICFLALSMMAVAAASGDRFLGRWDLTVTAASTKYPSWLEVTRSDGKLGGRFVGRSGSVVPVEVQLLGEELQFTLQRPPLMYTARLVD